MKKVSVIICDVAPISTWGRFKLYQAKIGSGPSTLICVLRTRKFYIGQKIKMFEWSPYCSKTYAPRWVSANIWHIDSNRLFIML